MQMHQPPVNEAQRILPDVDRDGGADPHARMAVDGCVRSEPLLHARYSHYRSPLQATRGNRVLAALGVDHMHRAGDARIERMNGTQDLQRPVRIGDRRVQQRRFISAALSLRIARSRVPGGRNHRLIVLDRFAVDLDPVAERAARRFVPSVAAGGFRPGTRIPADGIEDRRLAVRQIVVRVGPPSLRAGGP